MPSAADYENGVRKAMAAGDSEAADFLRQKMGTAREAEAAQGELEKMNPLERGLAGAGRGAIKMWGNAADLVGLGNKVPGRADIDNAASEELGSTTAGGVGQFVGEAAALAPIGMGVGGSVARNLAGRALPAATKMLAPLAAAGAAEGVAGSANGDRALGGSLGALGGTVLPGAMAAAGRGLGAAGRKISRGVRGVGEDITPEAQRLMARGVPMTTGQQLGPRAGYARMEQAAESLPLGGADIAAARRGSYETVNDLSREYALPPGMSSLPKGMDPELANEALQKGFKQSYSQSAGWPMSPTVGIPGGKNTYSLDDAILRSLKAEKGQLNNQSRQSAMNWLKQEVAGLRPDKNGHIQSDDILDLRETVRTEIRDLLSGETDDQGRKLARIYKNFEGHLTTALEEQLPNDVVKNLKLTDKAYANYAPVRTAQVMQKGVNVGQMPSPQQLLRGHQKNMTDAAISRGDYFPSGELARDASAALPNVAPETGARMGRLTPLTGATGAMGALAGSALGLPGAAVGSMVGPVAAGQMMKFLSLPGAGQRLALGQTGVQKGLKKTMEALERSKAAASVSRGTRRAAGSAGSRFAARDAESED